jgi:hypothetical protein
MGVRDVCCNVDGDGSGVILKGDDTTRLNKGVASKVEMRRSDIRVCRSERRA